jgi:outer membrane protein assembly factor BamB
MNNKPAATVPPFRKPLRLWPGVVLVILQMAIRFGLPVFVPDAMVISVFVGVLLGLAVVVWWLFFSRAPRFERWVAVPLAIVALYAVSLINDKSIRTAMMGMMFTFYCVPVMCAAFVAWAVASRPLSPALSRVTMIIVILLASGGWALLRTDGMDGEIRQDFVWRWSTSHEERLLSQTGDSPAAMKIDSSALTGEAEWPGFRGPNRDGIVRGVRIGTDWKASPPVEIWRRPVGPGCSSFAIHGAFLYTQEQRGEFEMVTCYNLENGKPVWRHQDSARFWDAHAGAGPRSTPTLFKGRVYTLGATGILNVLDEHTGAVVWSRRAAQDTKVVIPGWGYTGSPLVTDSVVIAAIAGEAVAYDIADGHLLWSGTDGGESYSSPHLVTLEGTPQIVFMNNQGATSYAPDDGKILWKLPWQGIRIVQPAFVSGNNLLIVGGDRKGLRRIGVKNAPGGWKTEERWTSGNLRPDFNDFVIHKGNIYGFDGPALACIGMEKGDRKWRGARYCGELLLLADQDLLLVLTEQGELALVEAIPDEFKELSRFPAIKGKTWNHPAIAGNVLVVRNATEMAAFRLPVATSTDSR